MRDSNINLKLSNVLNYLPEFFNRCRTELIMVHELEEELNIQKEVYYDICSNTIDGLFHIKDQKDFCLVFIEFCMDEFRYFKDIFDYSVEEILNICPGLSMKNYGAIYNKLIEHYDLETEMDTIGVGGYNVDFDSMMEPDLENYYFSPNEIFELKPEWKDGNEGEYFVIEDRDDKVLASPNWETGLSIIPQEVIRKSMILTIKPYMKQEKNESVTITPVSQIEEYVKVNSYFDSECSIDEDGDETILFTTRLNGNVEDETFGDTDYRNGYKLVDLLNEKYDDKLRFDLETVDEWIHVWGKRI